MRSMTIAFLASGALALSLSACDSPGGAEGGAAAGDPSGGGEASGDSFFGSFFGGGAAGDQSSNESGAPAMDPCEGEDCPPAPEPVPTEPAPVCEDPIPGPSGGNVPCKSFCEHVGGCRGESAASISACTADCVASLNGMELAGVTAMFGCFTSASCDAFNRESASGGTAEPVEVPPPGPDGEPTDPDEPDAPSEPPPAEEAPAPGVPEEDHGDEVWEDEIGGCIELLFEEWAEVPAPDAKVEVCAQMMAIDDQCAGDVTVEVGGEPAEGGSGSSGGGTPPSPPPPAPELEGEAAASCNTMSQILNQAAMDRLATCAAAEDCSDYRRCMDDAMVCMPFLMNVIGGEGSVSSGGSSGSGGTDAPPSVPVDPEPEPSPEPDPAPPEEQ